MIQFHSENIFIHSSFITLSVPYIPLPTGLFDLSPHSTPLFFFFFKCCLHLCMRLDEKLVQTEQWKGDRVVGSEAIGPCGNIRLFRSYFMTVPPKRCPTPTPRLSFPFLTHSFCGVDGNISSCGAHTLQNRLIQLETTPAKS